MSPRLSAKSLITAGTVNLVNTDFPSNQTHSDLTEIQDQLDHANTGLDGILGETGDNGTLLDGIVDNTANLDTKLDTLHTDLGHLTDNTQSAKITDGTDTLQISAAGAALVDGSATTQPVSGTVTVNAGTNLNTSALATSANQTNGTAQTKLTDGTDVADIVAGDSGNNGLVSARARKEVSFSTTSVQAVATTDVSNYAAFSVHIVTQGGSSTVTAQGSNDNINWVNTAMANAGSITSSSNQSVMSTTSAGVIFSGPCAFRYFRLNITGIVSGTTAGVVEFFTAPNPPPTLGVISAGQSGTWTVQPGNTPNTTPWLVQSSFSYNHISTATTTTVKSGAGVLHGISINSLGTVASTVTVYDNTAGSGTVIAILDSLATARDVLFDIAFTTGLTIVTTGTVAPDITVSYR